MLAQPRRRSLAIGAVAVTLLAAACGGSNPTSPGAASPSSVASTAPSVAPTVAASPSSAAASPTVAPSTGSAPVALTVGLGYIPSVQFAPFYLADQSGAYADAGLQVTLQNKIDPDLIILLAQGNIDIGSGDGTSVIPAVSQGYPVVYTSTLYGQFPAVVIAKAGTGIAKAADLRGKRIGVPGRFGTNWIMLQALLRSAGLTTDDVTIVEYPDFGQTTALQQGQVDAATGFSNNEPIQLRKAGIEPVVLTVDASVPLPGPGLVTGTKTLADKGDALRAFTAATLDAMTQITNDPQSGLAATFQAVPDLAADPDLQRQILDATIGAWKNPRTGGALGSIDRAGWQQSIDFLSTLGLVPNPVTVDQLVNESLLP